MTRYIAGKWVSLAVALTCASPAAGESANWRDGRKVFAKCKACHSFQPGRHGFGPSLAGVIGRRAGAVSDFDYSKALMARAEAGLIWTEESIDAYLAAPKKFMPKTKMVFPGLADPQDRRDVIAYVKRRAMR